MSNEFNAGIFWVIEDMEIIIKYKLDYSAEYSSPESAIQAFGMINYIEDLKSRLKIEELTNET